MLETTLLELILKSVTAAPNADGSSIKRQGFPSLNGVQSGLGVYYWQSTSFVLDNGILGGFQRLLGRDWEVSECRKFCSDFVWECLGETLTKNCFLWCGEKLNEALSTQERNEAEQSLVAYARAKCKDTPFWFPLNCLSGEDFTGKNFVLRNTPDIKAHRPKALEEMLKSPDYANADSWLGMTARNLDLAERKKRIVLGGICARLDHQSRYLFTMGKPLERVLSRTDAAITSFPSTAHFPYLAYPLILSTQDEGWLSELDRIVDGTSKEDIKSARCLRFLYSAWFAKESERFALLCMSIDALIPANLISMRAKSSWAHEVMGGRVDEWAVEALLKSLRSDIMHGDAPSLVEAKKYRQFVSLYHKEPLDALDALAAEIVRCRVFGQKISERANPISEMPDVLSRLRGEYLRYGLTYDVPSTFDFSTLKVGKNWEEKDAAMCPKL